MNSPLPCTTVTLRIFAIAASPPVSLPTTLSLCARSLRADRPSAAPKLTPIASKCATSSITAATCSSAFDGMQPTLRQTPPSVAIALDQHGLEAEVGGAERGGVAARAGAEDEQVALEVGAAGAGADRRARLAGARRRRRRSGCRAPARGAGAGAGRLRAAAAAAGAGAARRRGRAGGAPRSSVRITDPSLTVSPTLTLISFTTPACDDGISIDALSLSTVIRLCSTLTVSPGLTSTSMTATSLKSPMSGTLMSINGHGRPLTAAPGGSRRGSAPRNALKRAAAAPSIDAVVPAQDERQHQARLERLAVPARLGRAAADAEDRDLGRVDDRREVAAADAAERRDREAPAAHVARRQLAVARLLRELAHLAARSAARPSCRSP